MTAVSGVGHRPMGQCTLENLAYVMLSERYIHIGPPFESVGLHAIQFEISIPELSKLIKLKLTKFFLIMLCIY